MRIVIVGNGVAGVEAAMAIRAREPRWAITIVSEESDHFFSRTALLYVLAGQLSQRCMEPHERDLYERLRVTRVRARATGVDVEKKELRLAGGLDPLPYDRLLIACGSEARRAPWPGVELGGVGTFVTLQDLEWLERELHGGPSHGGRPPNADAHLPRTSAGSPYFPRKAARERTGKAPVQPVVIGGGLIGIEVVEAMIAAGLRPAFVIREEYFWPLALDRREAAWIAERLREHGADVRLGEQVIALEGDEVIARVRTHRGELPCDLCVVAIGVVPSTGWLRESAIELDEHGGVVVDAGLSTSAPDVFAAGDCASVPQADGTRRPEPLWYTARAQGRVAGAAVCGDPARYDRGVPYNSAKLMDVEYTTVGRVSASSSEADFYFEERGPVRSTTRIVLGEDGRVAGFNLLGRRWDHSVLMRWIEERRPLKHVLAHLDEAAFDTELVPRLVLPPA